MLAKVNWKLNLLLVEDFQQILPKLPTSLPAVTFIHPVFSRNINQYEKLLPFLFKKVDFLFLKSNSRQQCNNRITRDISKRTFFQTFLFCSVCWSAINFIVFLHQHTFTTFGIGINNYGKTCHYRCGFFIFSLQTHYRLNTLLARQFC